MNMPVQPAIKQYTVLEAQNSDCPQDVVNEVTQLWRDYDAGNDFYYIPFEVIESEEDYPIIAAYLKKLGIEECLIHFWW